MIMLIYGTFMCKSISAILYYVRHGVKELQLVSVAQMTSNSFTSSMGKEHSIEL